MTTYKVTLADGQMFLMEADLANAAAPILANFNQEEDGWQHTPYQTADARHGSMWAAELAAEYFKADANDCTDVKSVEPIEDPDDDDQ